MKDWLVAERAKVREQHDAGSPGIQLCTRLTEMFDRAVLDLYHQAMDDFAKPQRLALARDVVLVAHGGYGRRDVAPFSDVDLMILHAPRAESRVAPLARRLLHDLYDAGLSLGQSVRTVSDACKLGLKDASIFTSLVEARYLVGSEALFERFQHRFRMAAGRHWRRLVGEIERARDQERQQFGETVYLLEPNVKRSPGGLRDMQLLRWVGFARYGHNAADALAEIGELDRNDQAALQRALEFLLRLRNELHFHANKAHDVLDRAEQMRVAAGFQYVGTAGLLPVEAFMREYFLNSNAVQNIVSRFLERARPWSKLARFLAPMFSHQIDGDYQVGPNSISATPEGLKKLDGNLAEILRLTDLANSYNKRIDYRTWEAVR
ncbi:MAG TPA: [protein-PII] uridylyltransferase, partial [Pirellulales bacterium]